VTARYARRLVALGGGLAGLAAAVEARRAGLETCVVEQRAEMRAPQRLRAEFDASGAEAWSEMAAWGLWGHDLALTGADAPHSRIVEFEHLIVATGAFARPVAFPGWTLPGVMSIGGALRLQEQRAPLGERVVVAGFGGFARAAAAELQRRGLRPVAMLDAAARAGRLVVRAEGDDRLLRVVTARVDADWYPRAGTEQTLELDTLVLAFGYSPEDRLARLAGCDFRGSPYVDPQTNRDDWMRTSVPGVLVAGDAGGIVGPEAAIAQGRLAGLAAAVDSGCLGQAEAQRRARPIRQRLVSQAQVEQPRPGLLALADPDTIICRCEDVTADEVTEHIFEGSLEPAGVIAETRAGMGLCQGRNCACLIAATIARHAGLPLERIPPITPRPPVVPVLMGLLAERPPVFPPLSELSAAR